MDPIRTELLPKDKLCLIAPLWEKLNALHERDTRYWKERFRNMTFERRSQSLLAVDGGNLHIMTVRNDEKYLGYCVSSTKPERSYGEIESLYLEESLRGSGWGARLVGDGLDWMKARGMERIGLSVAEGHEEVLPFYGKMGFYPKMTTLEYRH